MASRKFRYNFLSEPDYNLRCSICLEVAKEPKQEEECGKLFCGECIENNGSKPCPNCRARNPQYFKDKKSLREIRDLHVACDYVNMGCSWKGTVGTLENHVTKCGHILVSCPNECQAESEELLRKDLNDHLKTKCPNRYYECKYCGEKGTYASITLNHDGLCKMKIVPCPEQLCPIVMERGKLIQHIQSVCDYTIVACKHKNIGCSVKKMRKYIKQHEEDDKVHLHLALEKLDSVVSTTSLLKKANSALQNDISFMKDMMSLLKNEVQILNQLGSITFKVSGFGKKKEDNTMFLSKPFYTSPGGYRMGIVVYCNGVGAGRNKYVSIYAWVLKGPYDDTLNWPFVGAITLEVLNQLEDENHYSTVLAVVASYDVRAGQSRGHFNYLSHSALSHDPVSNTQYLKDDTLYFRVTVEVDDHKPWLDCTQ